LTDIKITKDKIESIVFTDDAVLKASNKLKNNLSSGPGGVAPLFFLKVKPQLCIATCYYLHTTNVGLGSARSVETSHSNTRFQKRSHCRCIRWQK